MIRIHLLILSAIFVSNPVQSAEMIPFELPWDDDSESITNVSHLLEKPAGKHGFIRAEGDRLVDGAGKPFRILGVNTAFSGNFPTHEQAEKIAARMAKFGINAVRVHHLDTARSPNGIWKADTADKQDFDRERLDRLDYFIAALKKNGIYTNINLKVGRKTVEADGVPHADELPTYDKGPDHFYPRLIEIQKNYARDLLTHVNPYTGNNYLNEPAIVTIEINNESGLIWQWANRSLDSMPQEYWDVLQSDWNKFLADQYDSTEELRRVWTPESKGDGSEMLAEDLGHWVFQTIDQAEGKVISRTNHYQGQPAAGMDITRTSGQSWHVQMFYPQLVVAKGEFYQVNLHMKANPPRTVSVGLQQDHDPWQRLDEPVKIDLTNAWQEVNLSFSPNAGDDKARLIISEMANQTGKVWLSQPSMVNKAPEVLGDDEALEDGSIHAVTRKDYGAKTYACQRDWMAFLVRRETQYNQVMYGYLRDELNAKPMITGTQIGFAPYTSQLVHDLIDTHGYFNHPHFPNRQWDMSDWYVENESIINQENNVLFRLMERQVKGKPFTVSEYNHPAPMPFASEGIPLPAAYGAFQGWDGIYYFAYSHSNDYEDKSINSFFDIAGHTPKMLCMPAAANMFLRGDIQVSPMTVSSRHTLDSLVNFLTDQNGGLWGLNHLHTFPGENITTHVRTVVDIASEQPEAKEYGLRNPQESSTHELYWVQSSTASPNPEDVYVLIQSPKTKGFIGFHGDQQYSLHDGIQLKIGETEEGWANVLLTWMKSSDEGEHWLLTATGYSENQGMQWIREEKTSVGRNWGDGPPLVEPIGLQLWMETMSSEPGVAYPLDVRGQRISSQFIQWKREESWDMLRLDENQKSLWYEIVMPKSP